MRVGWRSIRSWRHFHRRRRPSWARETPTSRRTASERAGGGSCATRSQTSRRIVTFHASTVRGVAPNDPWLRNVPSGSSRNRTRKTGRVHLPKNSRAPLAEQPSGPSIVLSARIAAQKRAILRTAMAMAPRQLDAEGGCSLERRNIKLFRRGHPNAPRLKPPR